MIYFVIFYISADSLLLSACFICPLEIEKKSIKKKKFHIVYNITPWYSALTAGTNPVY